MDPESCIQFPVHRHIPLSHKGRENKKWNHTFLIKTKGGESMAIMYICMQPYVFFLKKEHAICISQDGVWLLSFAYMNSSLHLKW